ncbi:MAG TPA: hypothetical protein VF582_03535 [Allosphingosinicella sp.]|jgi:hypothetical protein
MRRFVPLIALLLATGCGGQGPREGDTRTSSQDLQTFDVAEEPPPAPASSGPNVGPSAAPGVAFNYRYAFRLPGERVAAVQEQHAAACERLGLARCRITGMRYRLINEEDIEGMLAFKLDPAIARQFGKAGVEAVGRAEGMLVDSEISGVDAGSAIQAANRADAQLSDDLRRIEAQLARTGLQSEERARLQSEAQQLRTTIRSNRASRDEQQESLATTPMVFQYGPGDLVPGFDTRAPVQSALKQAGENFADSLAAMFLILLTVLPWAALALLVFWIFRKLQRRFHPAGQEPNPAG